MTEGGTFRRATTPREVDAGIMSAAAGAAMGAVMPGLAEPEPAEVVVHVVPADAEEVVVAAAVVAVEAAVAVADAVVEKAIVEKQRWARLLLPRCNSVFEFELTAVDVIDYLCCVCLEFSSVLTLARV